MVWHSGYSYLYLWVWIHLLHFITKADWKCRPLKSSSPDGHKRKVPARAHSFDTCTKWKDLRCSSREAFVSFCFWLLALIDLQQCSSMVFPRKWCQRLLTRMLQLWLLRLVPLLILWTSGWQSMQSLLNYSVWKSANDSTLQKSGCSSMLLLV
jgi:hypothetical protein